MSCAPTLRRQLFVGGYFVYFGIAPPLAHDYHKHKHIFRLRQVLFEATERVLTPRHAANPCRCYMPDI